MLNADVDPLLDFLEEHWPGKFKGEDAAVWAREFQAYELEEVRTACITHKQNSRFRPYAREVREILIRLFPARRAPEKPKTNASRFKTVVAQQWAASHPQCLSDPESTIVMRYYRFWFFRVRKSITDTTEHRKSNEQSALPDDAARIAVARNACVRNCLSELLACGMDWKTAKATSEWIDSTDPEFEEVIRGICEISQACVASEQAMLPDVF